MSKSKPKSQTKIKDIKIVCFGGGSAIPNALLQPLKEKNFRVVSVTSTSDSGGAAGQLRTDFDVLAAGDIRRHFLALSDAPEWKKELWKFRFGHEEFEDGHKGHNFGNIFISGLEYILKDYEKVLETVSYFMEIKDHKVYPATIDNAHVTAELENGEIIVGEAEIDVPRRHDPELKIKKVYLTPDAKIYKPLEREIKSADLIVIGPSDLYSSLIPCFLPEGVAQALKKAKAKKVLFMNLMTKIGETKGFSVLDFTTEVESYLGFPLDFVVYNNFFPTLAAINNYRKKRPELVEMIKIDKHLPKEKFIGKNFLEAGVIEHDPKKTVSFLVSFLKDKKTKQEKKISKSKKV